MSGGNVRSQKKYLLERKKMNANELRIGNYVLRKTNIVVGSIVKCCKDIEGIGVDYPKVVGVLEGMVFFNFGDMNGRRHIDDVFPVKLTKEILLKCGFEDLDQEYILPMIIDDDISYDGRKRGYYLFSSDDYINDGIGVEFCVALSEEYEEIDTKSCCYGLSNGIEYKYLHQLQNPYFALTGKELEVKL